MYWQYRLVREKTKDFLTGEDETSIQLAEVSFASDLCEEEEGSFLGYTEVFPLVTSHSQEGIDQLQKWLNEAFKQPVIDATDFPDCEVEDKELFES